MSLTSPIRACDSSKVSEGQRGRSSRRYRKPGRIRQPLIHQNDVARRLFPIVSTRACPAFEVLWSMMHPVATLHKMGSFEPLCCVLRLVFTMTIQCRRDEVRADVHLRQCRTRRLCQRLFIFLFYQHPSKASLCLCCHTGRYTRREKKLPGEHSPRLTWAKKPGLGLKQ